MEAGGWVVVVEAQGVTGDGVVSISRLRDLLDHLPGVEPIGLHSAERVAVQVHVDARCEVDALSLALADLRAGLPLVGLWDLRVIRAEVMTREEFEQDCRLAYGEDSSATSMPASANGHLGRNGEQLLRQAFQDPLTHLLGRGFFMDRLEWAVLAPPDVRTRSQALVVLNLAGIGTINDRLGRAAGDDVLMASGQRLNAALAKGLIAGRIGGDDFAVLLGAASDAQAQAATLGLLDALNQPVLTGGVEVAISARAGIAMSRPDQHAGNLLTQARAAARAALEESKPLRLYRPGMAAVETSHRRASAVHEPLSYLLLMQRAAVAANESNNLENVASLVVEQICAHMEFQLGHLYVVSGDRLLPGELDRSSIANQSVDYEPLIAFLRRLSLGHGEGLAGRVLASGKPTWAADIATAEGLPWTAEARACGFNAALASPVVVGKEVVAVLEFFSEHTRAPDNELVEVLQGVGTLLGRVVERQRALA